MLGRLLLAEVVVFGSLASASAQFPPPREPAPFSPGTPSREPTPFSPGTPSRSLPKTAQPPASIPVAPALPDGTVALPTPRVETPLPREEAKFALDPAILSVKKVNGVWQIWAGPQPIRNLGTDETGAKDIVRLLQDQRPTDWVAIGSPRPFVEYGLVNGRPSAHTGLPRGVVPIDLRSVRLEPLKGVWCLRDDGNILFNFGLNKGDGEQALAVIRRYGFNRIGLVGGDVAAPAMTYFFVALEPDGAKPPSKNPLAVALQEQGLARTGIPVPGIGYVGEMVKIDWRKAEVRRDGADWIVASGAETLARFGQDQNGARDSLRLIQDGQFTEFCKAGPPGLTFFLSNGQLPSRLPLYVQGRRFDGSGLKVANYGTRWAVTDRGRHLFDVTSAEEGEAMMKLMKFYGFDQLCQVGSSPRTNLTFLAKGGR